MTLSPSIRHSVEQVLTRLRQQRELLSLEELESAYRTFRERFGPDVLAGWTGEQLLVGMFEGGEPSSLVHWLDFGDSENPKLGKGRFGLIGGGWPNTRFGLFLQKKPDSVAWVAGAKMRKVTLDEAIQIASQYRDQLVAGARVLDAMTADATESDYLRLQERLEEVAPDLHHLAWVHKYYHMLRPDVLDDYHTPEVQRRHLERLGVSIPSREGLYVCGHRYVQVARELGVPMNHLAAALNNW